jgi:hypothetical protein
MPLCAKNIDYVSFYDFSVGFCSDSVVIVIVFHFITKIIGRTTNRTAFLFTVWYGIYFTLLMFRKSNKTTINKNKTTHFYRSTSFRFLFIFRYFKVFQVKRILYLDISRSFKCHKSSPVVTIKLA